MDTHGNDFDAATNPGAVDPCDGVDNNCNFKIDETDDRDQDGASTCNGGDCDDLNPQRSPKNIGDVVDGVDNDCDCPAGNDDNGDGTSCDAGDLNVDEDGRVQVDVLTSRELRMELACHHRARFKSCDKFAAVVGSRDGPSGRGTC